MAEEITLSPLVIPLIATAFIAVVSFITRSRWAFCVALLACWGVACAPHRLEYIEWSRGTTYDRMLQYELRQSWDQCWNGVPSASIAGLVIGLILSELIRYSSGTTIRSPAAGMKIPS